LVESGKQPRKALLVLDEIQKIPEWSETVKRLWDENSAKRFPFKLFYWLDRNREVDFVLARGRELLSIEVKSGLKKRSLPGIEAFANTFEVKKAPCRRRRHPSGRFSDQAS